MEKRTLQELNLLDDFLFGKMVTYPEIGERFCKWLLGTILDVKLDKIRIVPQKVYLGADTNLHGARLDVYIEEEDDELSGTLFDMEPDKNEKESLKKALPQRGRFYHSMLDQECLKSGQGYEALKRVVVIFMMPYDPFGHDRMVYTVKNHCVELPDMPYDDGAKTLFLYTKGRDGNPSKELQELLRYMEETTKANACNQMLRDIHKMVTKIKQDSGVTLEYMKIFEREKMLYEDGKEDGIKEGREDGIKEGRLEKLVSQVFKKLRKNCDVCEIADMLEEDEHVIQQIYDAARKYAPDYDEEKCAELLEHIYHNANESERFVQNVR